MVSSQSRNAVQGPRQGRDRTDRTDGTPHQPRCGTAFAVAASCR
jgi:hypothetical protein